jgi:short-subunit dehydrogenase
MSTALVTGATAGIGLSFAHLLAERGHDVVLVARDRARLENVSDELQATYSVATEILVADLSDHADTGKVAERLADQARPVDLLVNNAGYSLKGSFLKHDVNEEVANFDVLCRAVLVLSHAAGRAMRERGHGAIVNVSSVASFITSGTYSANKSYVTVFTEGLAAELKGSGVTVTCLMPGATETEFFERAGMTDTKVGQQKKDDPADVARVGFEAMQRGDGDVVSGWKNKLQTAIASVTPAGVLAEQHRKMAEPGSGQKK